MTDKPTRTYCTECEHESSSQADHCPSCGAEDPWTTEPKYDMETVDFPVIIEREHYDDNYGMWRDFTSQVFGAYELTGDQIANMPKGFPRMKYCCPTTHWVVYEGSVDGPYMTANEARESIDK